MLMPTKLFFAIIILFLVTINLGDELTGELNSYCVTVGDCRSFGYMCSFNRTCQCSPNYLPNSKREKCVGSVDQKCKYDEHCIEGAYCQNQATCKCKEDYQPNFDGTLCSNTTNACTASLLTLLLPLVLLYFRI